MLKFDVKNQIITRTDTFDVISDSRNYLKAAFVFTEEWEAPITAIFNSGGCGYCVILDEDKTCTVPWEVIKPPYFTVSVFCGDLITTNKIKVTVGKSGYVKGETPSEPTPDVYTQILNMIREIEAGGVSTETIKNVVLDVLEEAKESGEFDGEDGHTPIRGTDYWTNEDIAEIKSYVDEAILGGAW